MQPHLKAMVSLATGGRLVTRLPRRSPTLYLTFDDGPDPEETPRLLEALSRFDIRATFFVVGREAERHPDLVAAIVRAGHVIGNHSMTHPRFSQEPVRRQLDEIASADRVLERHDGRRRHLFRPPYGRWTFYSLAACLLRSQKVVLWTHDSLDFRSTADQVVTHMRSRKINGGDILLFHDDGPVARESLLELVPEWKAAGFGFSTID